MIYKNYIFLIFGILLLIIIIIINCNCIEKFNNNFKNEKKYNIAIMSIFKNEHEYMKEWIDFHLLQGVEHIFLYCNDSNKSNYPYLYNNYYKNNITVIDWVDKKNNGANTIQKQAYYDCVKNYSNDCQFLLMLDLDEFLKPINNFKTIKEYVYSLKSNWDNIKAFKIQRYNFGSSGHKTKPNNSVVSSYKYREKICASYKTMANCDYINKDSRFFGVHDFIFLNKNGKIYNDYFGYYEKNNYIPNGCTENSVNEISMVINHYYTKSYEEYLLRCNLWEKGGINPINYRNDCINKFKDNDKNEILD